jgi:transglutaminase-like putative cysteine protease
VFPEPTREFLVEVDLVAEMAVFNPFDFFLTPEAEHYPFTYEAALDHELAPFQFKGPLTPQFSACLAANTLALCGDAAALALPGGGPLPATGPPRPAADGEGRPRTMDFLVGLNRRLSQAIKYVIRLEPGVQTPEETLVKGTGSCRDSAWLLCQLFRHCGLAARFVSGYLIQLTPDVKSLDGPSGTTRDFTDLHAWCEVYLPGAGWIGLDPTSGLLAGEGHVPLACAPDPTSAAPITGVVEACACEFSHEMHVTRIHESPRVTKPYSEAQWQAIAALGHAVDADLVAHDVRLTMGGEPTFVSIDDPEGSSITARANGIPANHCRAGPSPATGAKTACRSGSART